MTTGTVCTHSPLRPSCRISGDGQCSNGLSHAGMNMFATMHSGAVLPDDWLAVTTSAPPPHPLTTSALPPLPFPPHWLMFKLSRAPDSHAWTFVHAIPSTWTALLPLEQTSVCPAGLRVSFPHPHQSKSPRFNLYFLFCYLKKKCFKLKYS